MKKVTLLATMILALAMCASAQQLIDFTHLTPSSSPMAVPLGYGGLRWSNIYSVASLRYPDSNGAINRGAGFFTGPEALVAFGGGSMCFHDYGAAVADGVTDVHICEASVSAWNRSVFRPDSAFVSAGWVERNADLSPAFITVTAYRNGVQVGSSYQYKLSFTAKKLDFSKNGWGDITDLVIHPSPRGSFVIYTLQVE